MEDTPNLARLFNTLDRGAVFELILIAATAFALAIAEQRALPWIANRLHGRYRHYLLAAVPPLRLAIVVVALTLMIPILIEPSLRNMATLLGAIGLALGFALKDYASSLIAGVVSAFEQPYRPGDWIRIDGHYGEVVHVGLRTVDIVTADDDRISIPHLKLWDSPVVNANNGSPILQCNAVFHVHPEHDGRRARAALEDVALTSPYLQFDAPVQVLSEEHEWGSLYRIRAYPLDPRQQFRFITDLTVRGRDALRRLGARPLMPTSSPQPPALRDGVIQPPPKE